MISAMDAREGCVIDFCEGNPTLLIEVNILGLDHILAVV